MQELKQTTIERIPLNSNLFKAKDALPKGKRVSSASSTPALDKTTTFPNANPSGMGMAASQMPSGFSGYPMPWGYPPPMYPLPYYPSPPPFAPYQQAGGDGMQSGQPQRSSPVPEGDLDEYMEFCGHNWITRGRLDDLGFTVGQSLGSVPETEWKSVGFKYFEWKKVLDKDREYKKHVKSTP